MRKNQLTMSSSLDPLVQRTRARLHFGVWSGALELLESDVTSTRMAGIYALEALARDDAIALESAREVLSALVRRCAGDARTQTGARAGQSTPGDVQAALAVLGRIVPAQGAPLDLHGISLRDAFLPGARFAGALLYDCDLEGALLEGADLRGAWLWRAHLKRMNLDNADLRGADLSGARGLKREQISSAISDQSTRWPAFEGENAVWSPR